MAKEKLRFSTIGFTQGLYKFLQNPVFPFSVSVNGELDAGAAVITSGIQDVPVGGTTTAADLTKSIIRAGADVGGDILTIADGSVGQQLIVILDDATGLLTITPTTFNGGTSITMDALGDTVTLTFIGTLGWSITGGNAYTII